MRNMKWRPASFWLSGVITMLLFLSCGSQGPRSYRSGRDGEGWIGLYVQNIDRELQRYLDLNERAGVLINDVVSNGPAEKAGLQEEDVIVKFDGKRIRDTDDLTRAVRRTRPGETVEVEIIRDRQSKTLPLRVDDRRSRYSNYDRRRAPRVTTFRERAWLGVNLTEINEDLAPYFFVAKNEGVLILEVEKDSPADKAGLKAGDVILEAADRKVRTVEDVWDILSDYDRGDEIQIKIKRRSDTRTVKAQLDRLPYSYDFGFDEFNQDMRRWKENLKHWRKDDYRRSLENLDARIRIKIDDELRRNLRNIRTHEKTFEKLGEDLGAEMEKLGRDLEREMENLAKELERMEIELRYERVPL